MLNTKLPRRKFSTSEYPYLADGLEGAPIPLRWGAITNIIPACVDTTQLIFKLADNYGRAIKSVDEVRTANGEVLIADTDYVVNLNNATITITGTPLLQSNTAYYFVLESDYAINGTDYLRFAQGYAYAHHRYNIDGTGNWSEQGYSLFFQIIVKSALDGQPFILIDNFNVSWSGWNMECHLRDAAARTRIGQKFVTPASGGPWYLWEVRVDPRMPFDGPVGSPDPDRITKTSVLTAYSPSEIQLGCKSYRMENYPANCSAYFSQRDPSSDIRVDFSSVKNADESLMEKSADILKDSYVTVLGGSDSAWDTTALDNLRTNRPEALTIDMTSEISYREFLDKIEATQLIKILPLFEDKFTIEIAVSGEPSGTPHFRDEDFITFKCFRWWKAIYQKIKIKYDEDQILNRWQISEIESDVAQYCYRNFRTLEIETYHTTSTNADALAVKYGGFLESPLRGIEFESKSQDAFGLVPWQKIKITRSRADSATGQFAGELFRAMDIKINPLTRMTRITAILDTQTY